MSTVDEPYANQRSPTRFGCPLHRAARPGWEGRSWYETERSAFTPHSDGGSKVCDVFIDLLLLLLRRAREADLHQGGHSCSICSLTWQCWLSKTAAAVATSP